MDAIVAEAALPLRSSLHRWTERILAFGGLVFWLLSTYLIFAFAAALLTSLTVMAQVRVLSQLGVVISSFGAIAAHRWRPQSARVAHALILASAGVTLATCADFVELPPDYRSTVHRGVAIECADEGVAAELPEIRGLIDQVYARSGMRQPTEALRMRFIKNTGGRPFRLGQWTDGDPGGADVALTTDRGGTRGTSFVLEGSFLLTERLTRRAQPEAPQAPVNGFAYWTMLGMTGAPDFAPRRLAGEFRAKCDPLSHAPLSQRPSGEMSIWLPAPQDALHLNVAPFIDAELSGGADAARALLSQAAPMKDADCGGRSALRALNPQRLDPPRRYW